MALSSCSHSTVRLARRSLLCPSARRITVAGASRVLATQTHSAVVRPQSTFYISNPNQVSRFSTCVPTNANGNATTTPRTTFEDLGLHPPIIASLRGAFPHVEYPTEVQSQFIPAILQGKDVLLKDSTGSGKSFGLVLALLNQPRIITADGNERRRHITSLLLVPHRDLAYQYLYWIREIVASSAEGTEPPPLSHVAQVLVRDDQMHLQSGLNLLRESISSNAPPHILIATPQALMDIHKADRTFLSDHLSPSTLSAVCIDEADYLIETLARKDPSRSFRKGVEREMKRLARHPGPTKELLNVIYKLRREWNSHEDKANLLPPPSPQLIFSSATLRTHLRNYVYEESGWLDRRAVTKIHGAANKEVSGHSQRRVLHSVLLVSEERIRNVEGALPVEAPMPGEALPESFVGRPVDTESLSEVESELPHGFAHSVSQKHAGTASPFKPHMFEAIAAAFALDVPLAALLVLPASAPVSRALDELAELGINACSLDLKKKQGRVQSTPDNPTLYVSTLATTRGVDLPELSHVFVYGMPDVAGRVNGRSVDTYGHIAGRVGRFGRGGKIVTFVEGEDVDCSDEGGSKVSGGEKMVRLLETLGVKPVQFGHFDN